MASDKFIFSTSVSIKDSIIIENASYVSAVKIPAAQSLLLLQSVLNSIALDDVCGVVKGRVHITPSKSDSSLISSPMLTEHMPSAP